MGAASETRLLGGHRRQQDMRSKKFHVVDVQRSPSSRTSHPGLLQRVAAIRENWRRVAHGHLWFCQTDYLWARFFLLYGVAMPMCAMIGCNARSKSSVQKTNRAPGIGLHCLPKVITWQCERTKALSEERQRLWLARINRRDLGSLNIRVCGRHFISGKPAKLFDDTNPDWVPSLHLGYSSGEGPGVKGRGKSAKDRQLHFESSQFEQRRADGWKKLKYSAVPTLFPGDTKASKQQTQQETRSKRRGKRHKVNSEEPGTDDNDEANCKPEALASFCEVILTYENYSSDTGPTTVTIHQIPEDEQSTLQ